MEFMHTGVVQVCLEGDIVIRILFSVNVVSPGWFFDLLSPSLASDWSFQLV